MIDGKQEEHTKNVACKPLSTPPHKSPDDILYCWENIVILKLKTPN